MAKWFRCSKGEGFIGGHIVNMHQIVKIPIIGHKVDKQSINVRVSEKMNVKLMTFG